MPTTISGGRERDCTRRVELHKFADGLPLTVALRDTPSRRSEATQSLTTLHSHSIPTANMGGGHSRELELAQQQVARLTKDLKKVSTELVFKESALAAAIKKAPVPQADEQLKRQLAAAEAEAANYKQMTRDAPFLRELPL